MEEKKDVTSSLELWLRKNFMETNELARLIGCSRQIIWRIKKNKKVSENISLKIQKVTHGEVVPSSIEKRQF